MLKFKKSGRGRETLYLVHGSNLGTVGRRSDRQMTMQPEWWIPAWQIGGPDDPDVTPSVHAEEWQVADDEVRLDLRLESVLVQYDQVRSRERVRDLAEVFTHQREVDAMLDQVADAFTAIDVKFLEPACGSGNFLTEILRRKLKLVAKVDCVSQDQYEHRLLRAVASIYGIDISPQNITEARARMAHVLLAHYQSDANTTDPTLGFMNAVGLILDANVLVGDTLNAATDIELCDWLPKPDACFIRVWSHALIPVGDRDLFWAERVQDAHPVHYTELGSEQPAMRKGAS